MVLRIAMLGLTLLATGCKCETTSLHSSKVCIPRAVPAGTALRWTVHEDCGGCGERAPNCEVTVSANTIRLVVNAPVCNRSEVCPAVCTPLVGTCYVPALAAGDYAVRINEAGSLSLISGDANSPR